jgi:hypothetical protein
MIHILESVYKVRLKLGLKMWTVDTWDTFSIQIVPSSWGNY